MSNLREFFFRDNSDEYEVEIVVYESLMSRDPYKPYDRELEIAEDIRESFSDYADAIDFILTEALSFAWEGTTLEILLNGDQIFFEEVDSIDNITRDDLSCETLSEDIEVHDTLNPAIWDKDVLKPEVVETIKRIVDKFVSDLDVDGIDLKIKDILLLGSNANYNYTKDSDLDIHILADESSDCLDKHLPLIFNAYKTLFNKKYDININGINVELYVEDADNSTHEATGIYSLKNGWIKEPTLKDIPEIDTVKIQLEADKWIDKFDDLIEANPTSNDIEDVISELYAFRQEGLQDDGEFSENNLIFKEIRNQGYLEKLKNIRDDLIGKELSLSD